MSKALTLIGKLQHKYGFKPRYYNIVEHTPEKEELPTIVEEDSPKEVCMINILNFCSQVSRFLSIFVSRSISVIPKKNQFFVIVINTIFSRY